MRHERNVWVVGGDMRQAKLAELLFDDGHTVHTWALEGTEEGPVRAPDLGAVSYTHLWSRTRAAGHG